MVCQYSKIPVITGRSVIRKKIFLEMCVRVCAHVYVCVMCMHAHMHVHAKVLTLRYTSEKENTMADSTLIATEYTGSINYSQEGMKLATNFPQGFHCTHKQCDRPAFLESTNLPDYNTRGAHMETLFNICTYTATVHTCSTNHCLLSPFHCKIYTQHIHSHCP